MAKTYTLQGTVNAGFSTRWTDDDWREYTTANSLSGDDNKRRIVGKYSSNYRAVNITFDSTQLAALRGKTVTSVSLTVKLLVGEVAANSNLYKIGFKKNATASSSSTSADAYARESGSTTNGYVHKASSKMTAGNTYTITSTDGLSQSVPSYGYAIGVSQSATSYIILDTTATLTVTTNETDYSITLSYNANGGSGGPSAETKTGTASGTPSVSFTVSNTKPTRANASAGSYTVTYNANSGSVSPASASAARTTSYTFSKWNTKSGGGGTNYVGGDTITLSSSATLYAQWTSSTTTASVTLPTPTRANGTATYTVTYNANSGSVSPASATATKTTTYTFNKWNTKSDGSGTNYSAGAAYTPETNTTLYARWSSSVSTTSVTLPTPSRTGYTFNGWYDASSGGTKVGNAGASYTPSGNITLYAQWTIKTYTVSYNKGSNGTGTNTSDTKTHGTDLTLKGAIFTRTGYTQTGWSTTDGGSKTYNLSASYTANAAVTLYPFWTINTYTVYYKKGDYGTGTNTSDTKTYGTALTLKGAIFTRTGYTQTGWSTASNGSSKDYNLSGSYTTNAGTTLYPYWTINTYTVSYNANGGDASTVPDPQTKTHGTDLTLSSTKPTKSQATTTYTVTYNANSGSVSPASATATKTTTYTFSTWNTKSDGTGNSYSSGGKYTANLSATLYARYTSSASTTSVTLPTPTRTGYTFNGWYDAASGGNKIGNGGTSYTPTGNKTLYAHWTAATYTIKYDANGGTGAPSSQTKTYGVDLTLRSGTPTRSNATTNYTVTFNANEGSVDTSSDTATKTITYTFSKWNAASDGSGTDYQPSGTYSTNAAATLYAQWTSSASTTSVTLPTPTRTGYTFNGWYTAASGGTRRGGAGDSYTPTASVTLYAQWTIITYTITYKKGTYGTGTNTTATKTYGVALTLKDAIFTRTGYTQKGWSTAAAGTSKAYNLKASYTSNSAKTLYPYWEANTYAVKYNANGGSGAPSAQTKTYGVTLTLSSTKPTRSGYNFIQWNTKADGTGTNYASGGNYTANDAATLYAVWAAAASTVSTTNGTLGTAQTITITRNSSSYTHNLSYTYGSQTGTIATGVGTSYSWTPPTSMASAFPSSTSGTCTITCVTKSGSTTIGTTTTTCTLSIPSSIKPSGVALTASHYSANSTVSGWATFTKGYSQADLSVTYTLNGGATLASITFSGPGMSSTGTSTTARTSVLTTSGTNTWTVTVKDSRGRTASATASKTVYDYANPVISSIGTYRCDSDGTINNGSGAYVKFLPKFSVSSVNSKNSMQSAKLKWRVSGGSWSSQINVTNNTYTAVLGSGNIDITKTYEVSVTVTDKLNSTTATATLPSASGLWYGRGNDRLGLGGVPPSAGLHCDWDATFNGVLDVTPRRCEATLPEAGWYRAIIYNAYDTNSAQGSSGEIVTIKIVYTSTASAQHEISLFMAKGKVAFLNETSHGTTNLVDKIRYTYAGAVGYVDIHITLSLRYNVSFEVASRTYAKSGWVAGTLASVADSPSGETVLKEYSFTNNTGYADVTVTRTENNYYNATAIGRILAYAKNDLLFIRLNLSTSSSMPAGTASTEIARLTLPSGRALLPIVENIPAQDGNGVILLSITASGIIYVGNYSSTAVDAFTRDYITIPLVQPS